MLEPPKEFMPFYPVVILVSRLLSSLEPPILHSAPTTGSGVPSCVEFCQPHIWLVHALIVKLMAGKMKPLMGPIITGDVIGVNGACLKDDA